MTAVQCTNAPMGRGTTMAIALPRHRFTVDEYHRLAEVGLLSEDDRVELIDGEIIEMPPIGDNHSGHVNRFTRVFSRVFGDRALLHIQNPVRLGRYREPEPDVVLLRPRDDDYDSSKPVPDDVLLLVEVADSSLEYDRDTKAQLYAEAGIIEYWLVNLVDGVMMVYRDPHPEGYRSVQLVRHTDRIRLLSFPDIEFAVSEVLRPR